MVFASLKTGFARLWANRRLILIFYLANLFFALIVALPFRAVLGHFIGDSRMGEKLAGPIDMDFLLEFLHYNPALRGTTLMLALAAFAAYSLANLFLSGGAYAALMSDEKYSSSRFWGNSAHFFGRFFRLFLWGLPVFGALFCLQWAVSGLRGVIFGNDPYEYAIYWSQWMELALRWYALFQFLIIFDYARIYTVKNDARGMAKALFEGLRFTLKNFRRTFTLAFAITLLGILGLLIYNPLANLLSAPNAAAILALFLWQQGFMLFRAFLRLGLYSGQAQLYRHLTLPPVETAAPLPETVESGLPPRQTEGIRYKV